ncbi:FUN14 domain-containing protein 1-like [Bacillus rossius redtenbacheri]|uniref:FUN14 domain-containing protein 1-like n=1 Tax=Bacillus rossius redtenbacheri TaxID=93214 RepID=UPI002FDE6CAC
MQQEEVQSVPAGHDAVLGDQTWEVVAGGLTGLTTGLLAAGVFKLGAVLAGGGILAAELARARGYAVSAGGALPAVRQLGGRVARQNLGEAWRALTARAPAATAFVGGFLLGFGMR